MFFEEIKKDTLYIAVEIVNSNPEYNVFENSKETRNLEDLEDQFLNQNTICSFIKLDDTYIGIIDFILENPNDHYPWLGLLMIHGDYQGYGFGAQAYALFEKEMLKRGLDTVRIGVLQENKKAQHFWESQGFVYYKTTVSKNGSGIMCYQKSIE
ncbi:GNAT family N-acetyltransferase [Paenibacillus sp. BSR1-1]|uniref:GNAT family N-acetyltransferase n=1 Tax=Paenibacillus sp. BSR1-1 TaxID=3020845 RepID=UPI0025B1C2FA|nr:GNAT family N-acetyltransferase [Paenibacillus sp. BSR1-1]MDN3018717.1 GNAT family N-acetyltransferase [Paenibacillus sp. BSR1-1]